MPTATRVRDHCLAPARAVDAPLAGGTYRRLFPELAPLDCDDGALHGLGRAGGACDTPDDATVEQDAEEAAGWPFLGQFVAHDITADRSPLTHHAEAAGIRNARSPRANLECVYGDGPAGSPYLYDRDDPAKLLLGRDDAGRPRDLPRNSQGVALIGDPRNDVHLFMSQLHVAMLHLHNGLVDRLRADGAAEPDLLDEARRSATWHYQWVLLRDFLPRLVGAELADELLTAGPRHYRPAPGAAWIPLEFADGAYRTGTVRSASATGSTATPTRCRSSPTCWASGPSPPPGRSTGRACSTCRDGRRRSVPGGWTGAWPATSSGCRRR
jgi:hypothetical protein